MVLVDRQAGRWTQVLAEPAAKKCGICKKPTRMLKEKTSNQRIEVTVCTDCDGKLSLFARFDGDLPRNP